MDWLLEVWLCSYLVLLSTHSKIRFTTRQLYLHELMAHPACVIMIKDIIASLQIMASEPNMCQATTWAEKKENSLNSVNSSCSLALEGYGCTCNHKLMNLKLISVIDILSISCEIVLRWKQPDLTDDLSTLVQVMTASSHFLTQSWPESMSPLGITSPQWVKGKLLVFTFQCSTPSTPSSGTSVRKRKQFTVFEKLSVIDSITIDNPQTKVARETGINESTLRGWLREEASLRAFAKENASSGKVKMRRRTPMKGSKYSDGSAGSYPTDFPGVEWDPSWLAQRNWSSGADVFSMPGCSEASDGGPHGMKLEALSESVEKIKGELEPADMGAVESLLSLQTARAGRPSSSMMSNFPVKSEPGMEHGLMPPMAVGPRFPYFPLCPTAITKDHLYSYRIKTPVGKKRRRPDFQTSPEAARIYDSPQNSHRSPTASVASDTSKSPEDKNSSNKDGKQSPRASSDSLEIESAGKSVSVPVDFVFDQDRQEGEEEEDGEDESQSKDGETTTSSGRKR